VVGFQPSALDWLLTSIVRCNYQSQPTTSLSEILHSTRPVLKANDGTEFVAPFVNAKYRSCIRVVDYWPHKLEDFVVRRRKSEYEILSDYEGESSDTDDDVAESLKTRGAERELIWTWRFSLLVEDAGGEDLEKREKVWLMIDNESAQMLLHADATKFVILLFHVSH
jgi:protection-of-telomeres protein 1